MLRLLSLLFKLLILEFMIGDVFLVDMVMVERGILESW